MVGTNFVNVVIGVGIFSQAALAAPEIEGVSILSDKEVRIKPCQPVYVLLQLVVSSDSEKPSINDIISDFSREVKVNGKAYPSYIPEANAAAFFMPIQSSVEKKEDGTFSMLTYGHLAWNYVEQDFAFHRLGVYQIEFQYGAHLKVIVDQSTPEEREVVKQLSEIGQEFSTFMVNPENAKLLDTVAPRVEKILDRYPDTAYSRLLSVHLGFSKLRALPIPRGTRGDAIAYIAERVAICRKYFLPYVNDEITSPWESAAAYYLARELRSYMRSNPEAPAEELATAKGEAIALFQKVRDSPFSARYRAEAEMGLRELEQREAPSAEKP